MVVDVARSGEWELVLQVGSRAFVTREPTLAELSQMERASESDTSWLDRLILGDAPDWRTLGMSAIVAAMTAYETYLRMFVEKKRTATRTAVASGVASQLTASSPG